VLEGALDVEAGPVGLGQTPGRRDVHYHADQCGDHDQASSDRRRVDEPADRFIAQPGGEQQQGQAVGLGGEDLDPLEPVGVTATGRACCQAYRDYREKDRAGVGEHVRGVGQQRQRLCHHANDHLTGHEDHDQHERDDQRPAVGILADAVTMAVPVPSSATHGRDLNESLPLTHT
jgi:hypothetical protein